ncbi:MAG: PH domain-containing protein [Actinomycetaceae bacterium]|nr:PH domain-containing protein [Arcanobacterium sp.]MDD7687000.1 PH domain-containing protein [Actinomycetaceae bacterium]MDY5273344.1 PH domain-containing protein [Arcanobacterium sp.]
MTSSPDPQAQPDSQGALRPGADLHQQVRQEPQPPQPQARSDFHADSRSTSAKHTASAKRTAITSDLGTAAVPEQAWRRFHKITPITRIGIVWVALAYAVFNILSQVLQDGELLQMLSAASTVVSVKIVAIAVAAFVGVSLVAIIPGYVSWKRRTFAVTETGIHFRQGVLVKSHTQMRWDRVQSVEIQQTLFGRIFGFGTVKVESAGNDDDLQLGLLRVRDAAALRREILVIVDRVRSGLPPLATDAAADSAVPPDATRSGVAVDTGSVAGAAQLDVPDQLGSPGQLRAPNPAPVVLDADDLERDVLIYELPSARLIAANILSLRFIVLAVMAVAGIVTGVTLNPSHVFALGSALVGVLVLIIGYVWSFLKSLFDDYGTKLYLSENGLRRRAGLTKLVTSTYPPQRVHGVQLHRPWLWKRLDWWSINISRAGVAGDTESITRTFVPVATREQMLRILWTLLPGLGTDNDLAVLTEAFDGKGTGQWFVGAPKQAKWLAPVGWSGYGIALTERAAITRAGRLGRQVSVILQEHTQSLHMSAGPLQRKLALATLTVDLVPGIAMISAANLDADQLWRMMLEENERARDARRAGVTESLAQWKVRVGIADSPSVGT